MIQLKLDTQAVNSLFPEGSQARIDLQAAIIKNVVDSVIGKKVSPEIDNRISAEVNKQMGHMDIGQLVRDHFKRYAENRWGHRTIIDANPSGVRELAAKVKETLKTECDSIIQEIVQDIQKEAIKNLKDNESFFIQRVTQNLESNVRQSIVKQVNSDFPQLVDEAIKARLFPGEKA